MNPVIVSIIVANVSSRFGLAGFINVFDREYLRGFKSTTRLLVNDSD